MMQGVFEPSSPAVETRFGTADVHDGIWDVEYGPDGTFICAGYTAEKAWIGNLSPDLEVLWELTPDRSDGYDEALALARMRSGEGFLVAGNSHVGSPGTRHLLSDAFGWILCISNEGVIRWELDLSADERIVVLDVIPTLTGGFVCCGFKAAEGGEPETAWFGVFNGSGESLFLDTPHPGRSVRFTSLLQLDESGFIVSGTVDDDQSLLFERISTDGESIWLTEVDRGLYGSAISDMMMSDDGTTCIAAGGDLWDNPFSFLMDISTGAVNEDIRFDGWYTLFSVKPTDDGPVFLGHNMLCDGADSETYLISLSGTSEIGLPLRIYGYGAVRCRSFLPLPEDGFLIAGEVCEEWGGYQDIWLAVTRPSDWNSAEAGSTLFADVSD